MKVLKINEFYSEIGQLVNCFYSFFLLDGTLYSVHRRHRLFSFDNWPKNEVENLSQIVLTEYINKSPNQILTEEVLCDGNDPRVVSDGTQAYIFSEGAVHSEIIYTLTLFPEKKNIAIKLGKGVVRGKNWQPIIKDQELYVIDSISPFRVNKINIETGGVSKVEQVDTDFTLAAAHDNYAVLRGGSNAIMNNSAMYGWGHATVSSYSHIPYVWEYRNGNVITSFVNIHSYFKNKGYNIVDPGSFFEWDEQHFALSLSCSQRDWFHPQWFFNTLVLIDKDDFFNKKISFPKIESIRNSMIFHAIEMDGLIDSRDVNGGRSNEGLSGCLVCGPSKEIDISKKWTVELCYSSRNKSTELVGDFDILLTINGIDKHVASTQIFGMEGKSKRIRLTFEDKTENNTGLIQTRVFSQEKVSLIVYFFELNYGG